MADERYFDREQRERLSPVFDKKLTDVTLRYAKAALDWWDTVQRDWMKTLQEDMLSDGVSPQGPITGGVGKVEDPDYLGIRADMMKAVREAAPYDATEQDVILDTFRNMLAAVTRDGGRKRQVGTKPPWWRDHSHEAAIFSHLNKWKHGSTKDADSGTHPLAHLAWRALAIAYQETYGCVDPKGCV